MNPLAINWTPAMDAVVRERYTGVFGHASRGITTSIAADLSLRPHNIRARARKLGLSNPREPYAWTDREHRTLETAVRAGATDPVIAQALERTTTSVANYRKRHGLHRPRWSRANQRDFRGLLSVEQVRDLHRTGMIPAPNPDERPSRASRIWSRHETDYLLEHAGTRSLERIARELSRSLRAVSHKAFLLGCQPTQQPAGLLIADVRELTNASQVMIDAAVRAGILRVARARTTKRRWRVFDEQSVMAWRERLERDGWCVDPERERTVRDYWPTVPAAALKAGVSDAKVYRLLALGTVQGAWAREPGRGRVSRRVNPRDVPALRSARVTDWRTPIKARPEVA